MNIHHGGCGRLTWDACEECEYGQGEDGACSAPRELVFLLGVGDVVECDQFREAH